jgi:hypothetical protein
MPIRWSAVEVSEALDQVEQQLVLAASFLASAEEAANKATGIRNLPQYMFGRFSRLADAIREGRRRPREAVRMARLAIPEGAIEAEKARGQQHKLQM